MSNNQILINIFKLRTKLNQVTYKYISNQVRAIHYRAVVRSDFRSCKSRLNVPKAIKEHSYKVYSHFSGFEVPSYEFVKRI